MTDKYIEAVRTKLLLRSEVGLTKYNVSLERSDYDTLDWLREAQNEAMDLANYLEVLIQKEIEKESETIWDGPNAPDFSKIKDGSEEEHY